MLKAYAASCWKIVVSYKISTLMPIINIIPFQWEFLLFMQVNAYVVRRLHSGNTNFYTADKARKQNLAEKS